MRHFDGVTLLFERRCYFAARTGMLAADEQSVMFGGLPMDFQTTTGGLACLGTVVLFLGLALLVIVLTKKVSIAVFKSPALGPTLAIRIVALGLVTLCAGYSTTALLVWPVRLVLEFLTIAYTAITTFTTSLEPHAAATTRNVAVDIVRSTGESLSILRSNLLAVLSRGHFIRVFAGWVFYGQLIGVLSGARPDVSGLLSVLGNSWSDGFKRVIPLWQNAVLVLLLLFGSYMSIAAIVMIPWLHETSAESLSLEYFDQQFPQSGGAADFDRLFPETLGQATTSLATLESDLASLRKLGRSSTTTRVAAINTTNPASQPASQPSDSSKTNPVVDALASSITTVPPEVWLRMANNLEQAIAAIRSQEQSNDQSWKEKRREVLAGIRQYREKARGQYAESFTVLLRKSERQAYLNSIGSWYRQNADASTDYLRRIYDQSDSAAARSQAISSLESNVFFVIEDMSKARDRAEALEMSEFFSRLILSDRYTRSRQDYLYARPIAATPLPALPQAGKGLSYFGLIAGWLLNTQSLALALITGMLGFGILGSAVSTFVREQKQGSTGNVIVKDVYGVAIRGVSAAVVVYLTVVGGLSVFASDVEKPNPYALFLTCLIGSVFSDRIWAWAQRYLATTLGDTADNAESTGAPDGAENQGHQPTDQTH